MANAYPTTVTLMYPSSMGPTTVQICEIIHTLMVLIKIVTNLIKVESGKLEPLDKWDIGEGLKFSLTAVLSWIKTQCPISAPSPVVSVKYLNQQSLKSGVFFSLSLLYRLRELFK